MRGCRLVLTLLALPPTLEACTRAQAPAAEPGPHGPAAASAAACQALYAAYQATAPRRFKMRHQVSATVGQRHEVIEGLLVMERPHRFRVRAMGALGAPLFDVRSEGDEPPVVKVWLDVLRDARLPQHLARDIRRIYVLQCPEDAPVTSHPLGCQARCRLEPGPPSSVDDAADDELQMRFSAAGLLLEKSYSRAGQPTAHVSYSAHRPVAGTWLAHRIDLEHATLPYSIALALLAADLNYDTARAFTPDQS